jgi:hypothetical protein
MVIELDRNKDNNDPNNAPPSAFDDIFTSRRHSMDYFTVDGVKLRTGYQSERDWYFLPIRELIDNAADFLTKHYRGSNDAYIKTWIIKNDELLRIRIRNSNHKNIPTFQDLSLILDYDMRYGSKQNVYVISRGMLGDALKQVLSLGYVLIHLNEDGNSFVDQQWNYPLIIRHNGQEQKVYLRVDKANQTGNVTIENSSEKLAYTDTEIEIVLPSDVNLFMPKSDIIKFCKEYPIFTTDISFEFRISDESKEPQEYDQEYETVSVEETLYKVLSSGPPKAITRIDFSAIHPISKEHWTNSNCVNAYRPEEFVNRLINVHSKNEVTVYDVLRTYREGSNMKKTHETSISIAELMLDPDKDRKIEKWYKQLKKTLPPIGELSLPYTTTNKERANSLLSRVAQLFPIDNEIKPAYKVIRGIYNDNNWRKVWVDGGKGYREEKGRGIIQFPFVFEILAVPLRKPLGNKTEFIGAINYSVSPLNNTFEGDYRWYDEKAMSHYEAKDILQILSHYGFHRYYGSKSRISCVIVANLVTPRRDPNGYDKSRIDTQPFAETIAEAVKKLAAEIPTFRAVGYKFSDESNYRTARWHSAEKKQSVKEVLIDFLIKERGLPA